MRILVIEDEERLAEIIRRVLQTERFDVEVALRGDIGLERALAGNYSALIVDRMLPGVDGLEVIRQLRQESVHTPALVLTARGDLPERVEGLDAGADDYLGKPFAFEELIARLRAIIRRGSRPVINQTLEVDGIVINLADHTVRKDGQFIELSQKEYSLLETLVRNRNRIMSRDELVESVWGYDADPRGNVVELYVHYLRRKLDDEGTKANHSLIRTVRGTGYQIRSA